MASQRALERAITRMQESVTDAALRSFRSASDHGLGDRDIAAVVEPLRPGVGS